MMIILFQQPATAPLLLAPFKRQLFWRTISPEKPKGRLKLLPNFCGLGVLKVRIIPTLLWKDFGLVRCEFDHRRRVGSVVPSMKVYNARDVDELFWLM